MVAQPSKIRPVFAQVGHISLTFAILTATNCARFIVSRPSADDEAGLTITPQARPEVPCGRGGFQAGESYMGKLLLCATAMPERPLLGLWCCWPVPRQLEAQPSYAAVGVANGHAGSELIEPVNVAPLRPGIGQHVRRASRAVSLDSTVSTQVVQPQDGTRRPRPVGVASCRLRPRAIPRPGPSAEHTPRASPTCPPRWSGDPCRARGLAPPTRRFPQDGADVGLMRVEQRPDSE